MVLIGGRSEARLAQTKKEFDEAGLSIRTLAMDVSRVADCARFVAEAVALWSRVDVVVNSAGIWLEGTTASMTEEQWDQVMDVNLKGTFFISRYAIPELLKTKGCIINIGSDAGLVGNAGSSIYCASKGGVTLLTKALALEMAPWGVRVNAVCPADVNTPMLDNQANLYGQEHRDHYLRSLLEIYPQGRTARFITPEEVAGAIFYLASPQAAPITGTCLTVDFGLTAGYQPGTSLRRD
jgi:NAD(P)-dependent dehydrogenase (short-subunit alcohol dehydrogenase family)